MIDEIHARLYDWAHWVRTPHGINLGYPNADLVRRSVYGGTKSYSTDDSEALEIEAILMKAPAKLRRVADYKYVKSFTHGDIARREDVSKAQVKILINMLQLYIKGALDQLTVDTR